LLRNPALKFETDLNIDLSLAKLYEISDLHLAEGMLALDFDKMIFAAGMSQLEYSDVYWEREYVIVASSSLGHQLRYGASARYVKHRPQFVGELETLPLQGTMGVSYDATKIFSIHAQLDYHEKQKDRLVLGQQIKVHRDFAVCFGIGTEPTELSGGVSFQVAGFEFDYAYRDNVNLGGTHKVGMRYAR
jgi:hypothetical protein